MKVNSQKDSYDQTLMEFIKNYDWDQSLSIKSNQKGGSGKKLGKDSFGKSQNSVKLSLKVKGEKQKGKNRE